MKTMNRRPSTVLSRVLLAVFLFSVPGSREAFAQVAGRVGLSGVSAVAAGLGAAAMAPGLAAPISAPGLSAAPLLSAPAATPAPAASILNVTRRSIMGVVPNEPKGPTALNSLASGGASNGGQRFDGSRAASAGDDDPSRGFKAHPSEAPSLALTKVYFPGVNSIELKLDGEHLKLGKMVLRGGGYMIATTQGSNARGQSDSAVLARLSLIDNTGENELRVLMTIIRPVKITGYSTVDGVSVAKISYVKLAPNNQARLSKLETMAKDTLREFAVKDPSFNPNLLKEALDERGAERLTNLLAQELPLSEEVKLQLLQEPSTEERLKTVIMAMTAHFNEQAAKPKDAPESAPRQVTAADRMESVNALKIGMRTIGMPAAVQEVVLREYAKLAKMNAADPETQKLRAYVEWLLELPWSARTEDNLDVAAARRALDKDHFGLEKVKERVLEFLAVRKRTGSKKGAILAFTGPPGVGKTSIAEAISQALGRKFVRLSLGGVHDETVLRGHGRTYLGSMPGEIMRQMRNAGTVNPVMLLDEADKIGRNGNAGDPTAALLEVLDPAQNNTFRDRYLDVPYDLSEVLFVVTSNELSDIPEPLRDRMEIIEFEGYTTLEKMEIARRHVVPQKLESAGLKAEEAALTPNALRRIIEGYTMEAGVRSLRQKIEAVLRKVSAWIETKGEKAPGVIDEGMIAKYLGIEQFSPRPTAQNGVGVATGLAVSGMGGSTLNVEVSKEPGSGQLKLRNQFGKDIEDSAKNAYKYVKLNAEKLGLKDVDFTAIDVDINITPAGKVDGPSAGGLMVTAIVSALTGRAVAPGLAMTGEITMRGDILPIGGLKAKVMAAHRMGYREVIFPAANLKDIQDIPKEVRDGITLTPAKTYDDIFPRALVPADGAVGPKGA